MSPDRPFGSAVLLLVVMLVGSTGLLAGFDTISPKAAAAVLEQAPAAPDATVPVQVVLRDQTEVAMLLGWDEGKLVLRPVDPTSSDVAHITIDIDEGGGIRSIRSVAVDQAEVVLTFDGGNVAETRITPDGQSLALNYASDEAEGVAWGRSSSTVILAGSGTVLGDAPEDVSPTGE